MASLAPSMLTLLCLSDYHLLGSAACEGLGVHICAARKSAVRCCKKHK